MVIVAGVITLWLAVRSSDGLVTDDYYKQGLAVNQVLERDHRAAALGLRADLMRSGMNVRLLLGADTGGGWPDVITLKLSHPTRAGNDEAVKMHSEGNGFYSGKLNAEISGRWHVNLEDPAGQWRLQGDWQSDGVEPLRLEAKAARVNS